MIPATPEETPSPAAVAVLTSLLEARTGQHLDRTRAWRIGTSLKPLLREEGLASLDALVGAVVADRNPALAERVVDALLNRETSFFRDAGVIDGVADLVGEMVASGRRPRIWSAGCSTGQEIYSLAIALVERGAAPVEALPEMLATDVSPGTIERAAAATYSQFEIQRGLPVRSMLRWFAQSGEQWTLAPEIAARVRFRIHNLIGQPLPPGRYDVVMCRNVLLYFSAQRRREVLDRIAEAMPPEGTLVLGAGETVIGLSEQFAPCPVRRGFYRRVARQTQRLRA